MNYVISSISSCWPFNVISFVESVLKLDGGELVPLSEQQLMDCVRTDRSICHDHGQFTRRSASSPPKEQAPKSPTPIGKRR